MNSDTQQFEPVQPWPEPARADCVFYHSITYPDGEAVEAAWDIRGHFESYIGKYPIAGKTLLDVGTASGFLTFEAENAGAIVTSLDAGTAKELTHIPVQGTPYYDNRAQFVADQNDWLRRLKNSYWYGWHKFRSKADVVYAPLAELPFWGRRFDVVLAGAILEHLSDPVTMIGNLTRLANEAVIVAYTPVGDTDELIMRPFPNWRARESIAENSYTWWELSRGLYKKVFDNIGFRVNFVKATAIPRFLNASKPHIRPTIIATRK